MAIPRWTSTAIVEGERRAACRDSLLGCVPPHPRGKMGVKWTKKWGWILTAMDLSVICS